jgi:hypothetical protein
MPIETQIEIQTAFEVSPQSLSEVQILANRTEYLLLKTRTTFILSKKAVEAYYQHYHKRRLQLYWSGPKCLLRKTI